MATYAANFTSAHRSDWSLPIVAYGAFVLASIALLHPTAVDMAAMWLRSSSHHHAIAVAPLSLWMIAQRPRIAPATSLSCVLAVFAAAIVWLGGRAAGVALIEQFAFVSLLIAGAGAIFGAGALRLWALPLGFLYFMVPFGAVLIPPLQVATANTVIFLLGVIGMPVMMDGVLIQTPAGLFEIAEACAGLNFLLAALMIAAVYACVSLRSAKARISFLVIAVSIALVANFLRAFLLIWVATITNMRIAVGADHLVIGLAFYGLVFAILLAIGERMRIAARTLNEYAPITARRAWRTSTAAVALAPIIAASFYANILIANGAHETAPLSITTFNAPGWRIMAAPQNWSPTFAADRRTGATYVNNGDTVYLTVGYLTHDRRGAEIINYNNRAWNGEDWRHIASRKELLDVFGDVQETKIDIIAGPERRRLAVATVYWRGNDVYTDPVTFKQAQMKDKLAGLNPPGGIIMVAAAYEREPEQALRAIRAFLFSAEPFAAWRYRNGGAN